MTNKDIVDRVKIAIKAFQSEERPLQTGANERAIAHRIAVHMENLFPGWDIDCEYNKHGTMFKILEGIQGCDEQKKTDRIFPDIIVHKRRNHENDPEENLLVIEIKKNVACDPCDKRKLELFTKPNGQYKYQLGLYINFNGPAPIRTWYSDGFEKAEVEVLGD